MSDTVRRHGPVTVSGRLGVPGDKSISHRALIFSSLAEGRTRITNLLDSADCLSTLGCLRALGVEIELTTGAPADSSAPEAIVSGRGLFGLEEPSDVLDVGNSGKYMIENETEKIYGIKAYGVIHRGHFFGTLDEWIAKYCA